MSTNQTTMPDNHISPAETRQRIGELCKAYAAAATTGNAYVINAVAVAIEMVDLPRLIPDLPEKPTLSSVMGGR